MSTLDYYNNNAIEYFQSTKDIDMEDLRKIFIKYLKQGDSILDFGCGSARDSLYFKEKGFDVYPLDGSEELAKIVEKEYGLKVRVQDFNDFEDVDKYDAVWACASLLHIESDKLKNIISRLAKSIHDKGIIYICIKDGEGESTDNLGRFFSYFSKESFEEILEELELKVDKYVQTSQNRSDGSVTIWHNFFIKK